MHNRAAEVLARRRIQADFNGAQIMNDVGYDPTQMAVFFKSSKAGAGGGDNSQIANFLARITLPRVIA